MSIFNSDSPDIPENPFEALVGEGKKYATADDIAKAKLHADATIEQRNKELADLRAELQTRLSMEELLAKVSPGQTPAPVTPPVNQPAVVQPEQSPIDVAALVQQELNKLNLTQTVERNVQEVTTTLIKHFGDEDAANRAVKLKANELGVSVEFLQDVAKQTPKAFFATIGIDPNTPPAAPSRPTHGDVNAQALSQNNTSAKPGTYAFYESIRKSSPALYFSPKIQMQMHKDAQAKGEDFYK